MEQEKHKDNRGWGSQLNPETAAKILKAIREGNHSPVAAHSAGISPNTLWRWVARGEDRDSKLSPNPETIAFALAFREAEAECESVLVNVVYEKAKKDPYLALKYLARRFPDRWGNKVTQEIKQSNWEEKALEMIQKGELDRETVESEFGTELADRLFAKVGQVQVVAPDRPKPAE